MITLTVVFIFSVSSLVSSEFWSLYRSSQLAPKTTDRLIESENNMHEELL